MKKYEKIYQELRKTLTDEEIADSMLIPEELSAAEQKKADEELRAFRFKLLRERTEEQRIFSDLMRLRFQIEDYIESEPFSEEKTIGKYIEEYLRILGRTKKSLSEDLAIHYTRLSRIINNKEEPNIEFIYRLEKHSGNLIAAMLWWRLITKKQEYVIKKNDLLRNQEAAKVTNGLTFAA